MKRRLFISYRRAEDPWAIQHIHERLCNEYGNTQVFLDTRRIEAGESWLHRLDQEIESADAVILVYGKNWVGKRDDGSQRITEADDPVRYELTQAHRLGKKVIPIVIDAVEIPTADVLPENLGFLLELHFQRLLANDSLEHQINQLIFQLRRSLNHESPLQRLMSHAAWVGLVSVAMVWCLSALGLETIHDGYASLLRPLMAVWTERNPTTHVYIAINDDDHRELFGGNTPLNPEITTIALQRLREASALNNMCGRNDAPIGINIDLAPGPGSRDSKHASALIQELKALSRCRPLVLSCPASLAGNAPPAADEAWVRTLKTANESLPKAAPIRFARTTIDPVVLRHSVGRFELGVVMGDIARSRPVYAGTEFPECACPASASDRQTCQSKAAVAALEERDERSVLIPTQIDNYTLSQALLRADEVTSVPSIVLGTSYGQHGRFSVPEIGSAPVPAVHIQAYMAYSTYRFPPWDSRLVALVAELAFAFLTTLTLIVLWTRIATHPRFQRRLLIYLEVGAVVLGTPLLCTLVVARWPSLLFVASNVVMVILVASARSALTGYEVLLNGGVEWRSIPSLWAAIREGRDRPSATAHLAASVGESLVVVAGLVSVYLTTWG